MKYYESKYCSHAVKFMLAASVGVLSGCYGGNSEAAVAQADNTVSAAKVDPNASGSSKAKANAAPTITLISPFNGDSYVQGDKVLIEVEASDKDGKITRVDFYRDGSRLVSDKTAPYAYSAWSGMAGSHEIYAVAFDDDNASTMSASRIIKVTPPLVAPTVSLTAPLNGSNYVEGDEISIEATASDADGNIARVEFYSDGKLLGSDTTAPYSWNWSGTAGSHELYAVAIDNDNQTTTSELAQTTIAESIKGSVVTYPMPLDVKQNFKSSRYAVYVTQNGTTYKSFVYEEQNSADPGWSGTLDYMQAANHWTTFSLDGSARIQAQRLDGQDIKTCVVRPLSLGIETKITANKCNFDLPEPAKISVEIDADNEVSRTFTGIGTITKNIVKHPLFIFADPLEIDPPSASGPNVVYFGPGLHEIGKAYTLPNNTQVYIAGGAYVIGNFVTAENNPTNIVIRGRGILSGYGMTETDAEHSSWANHAIDFSKGSKGSGLLIEGITITDPLRSCIVSYNQVDIRNVKLFSWNHRNDGIVAGNNSVIEDNFIKVTDDNLKLYYSNQTIRRNVVWQQTSGAVFKFAWNLGGIAQNNSVSDIDIIHSDVFNDYPAGEPDRPDMQGKSAIFSAMGFKADAAFQNNTFDNIRVEEKHLLRMMSLRMVTTHVGSNGATNIWGNPDPEASKLIYNLNFNNIELAGVPYKASTLYGNAGGVIKKFLFTNMKVNGSPVQARNQLASQLDSSGLLTDGNVWNIMFE